MWRGAGHSAGEDGAGVAEVRGGVQAPHPRAGDPIRRRLRSRPRRSDLPPALSLATQGTRLPSAISTCCSACSCCHGPWLEVLWCWEVASRSADEGARGGVAGGGVVGRLARNSTASSMASASRGTRPGQKASTCGRSPCASSPSPACLVTRTSRRSGAPLPLLPHHPSHRRQRLTAPPPPSGACVRAWDLYRVEVQESRGLPRENCCAWPTWLPLGCESESTIFFINCAPSSPYFGQLRYARPATYLRTGLPPTGLWWGGGV